MGWGEWALWACGFLAVATLMARIGDWLIGGWHEIEAIDDEPPAGRSPRGVRGAGKGRRR